MLHFDRQLMRRRSLGFVRGSTPGSSAYKKWSVFSLRDDSDEHHTAPVHLNHTIFFVYPTRTLEAHIHTHTRFTGVFFYSGQIMHVLSSACLQSTRSLKSVLFSNSVHFLFFSFILTMSTRQSVSVLVTLPLFLTLLSPTYTRIRPGRGITWETILPLTRMICLFVYFVSVIQLTKLSWLTLELPPVSVFF